ncbi:hypothetical protein LCGC14_0319480 [marine sediment metagenome]|uniref:Lipocalin-like domain-containing protein n=1 Tax=marine sediment metagenome TaxID=412755 RepID=A0A0F9TJV3_9ZZZZ|nr:hypothetical protein [Maribacter sp.]HDZ06602.1 hypothetical protein [Maribacter sp.]HEA81075.1 hypothetical protein [Maribacter sp.]
MKITRFLFQGILLVLVFCSFSTIESNRATFSSQQMLGETAINNSIVGVWNYSMSNVEAPYENGVFFITQKEGSFDVALKLSTGILTGQDVIVTENGINFNVNFEGLKRVSFVLIVKGDKIMGETFSDKGSSEIYGVRQLPGR